MKLHDIARELVSADPATKSLRCYAEYDDYFRRHGLAPRNILEVGVHKGESTRVFARGFPEARIVAVDLVLHDIDFSAHPNVRYLQCDQTDRERLEAIVREEFPDGLDLVLDDASHIGACSAATFLALWPHLRSGGVYIVEDWGTGYLDGWIDGAPYRELPAEPAGPGIAKRLPSHDHGMVGFVKSLVDLAHDAAMRDGLDVRTKHITQIRSLEFTEGICFALKL